MAVIGRDEFIVREIPELTEVAKALIKKFPGPTIFLVEGDMGAGKTTFINAICGVMKAEGVSSPTFSLINEYHARDGKKIIHADMYRIRELEEALQFGFEEYPGKGHYFFIEWPEIIRPLVPGGHTITIEDMGEFRKICF